MLLNEGVSRSGPITLFLIGLFLLLPMIWSETSITGQDEYWLSLRTPMESMERGSWLTPWVNGEPRLKKPPLLYWAIILSYKCFGINLFAARIWGVLAGAGLAVCSFLLYRELFRKNGMLAGLITLGTIAVVIEGRRAMLDLPVAFFTGFAVYYALKWGRSGRWTWILLSALLLGLSFMVKGPIGFIFFAAAALSALFLFGKWNYVFSHRLQVTVAFILLAAVSLPWPLIMAYLQPEFFDVIGGEISKRKFGTIRFGSPLSVLGKALSLAFPWSIILMAAMIRPILRRTGIEDRKCLWLTIWFLACLAPCIFMKCFSRYMIPIIPAACVLCAYWLETTGERSRRILLRITLSLTAVGAVLFCLFFIWFGHGTLMAVCCLLMVSFALYFTWTNNSPPASALLVAVVFASLIGGLYPSLKINALPQDIGRIVGAYPVASYHSPQPSMLSIHLKRIVIPFQSHDLGHFDGFVFMRESHAQGFEDMANDSGIHFEKGGQFKSFYSRKTWIRFAREDATADDWRAAVTSRSLENLKPTICYYRVYKKNDNA